MAFDKATSEWFKKHIDAETTVMTCEKCGLDYKPSLGHKCVEGKYKPTEVTVGEYTIVQATNNHISL